MLFILGAWYDKYPAADTISRNSSWITQTNLAANNFALFLSDPGNINDATYCVTAGSHCSCSCATSVVRQFALILQLASCQAQTVVKTPRLKAGQTVEWCVNLGIRAHCISLSRVSPAFRLGQIVSNFTKYREDIAADMAQLGVKHKFSNHSFDSWGYFAGKDEVCAAARAAHQTSALQERAADIMAAYRDTGVAAIIANRGGWGCNRIIDLVRSRFVCSLLTLDCTQLNYDVIKANPKVGFSLRVAFGSTMRCWLISFFSR